MNIKKIESDFLKGLFSKESNKYLMTEYEGKIGYSDGYYIGFVPTDKAFVKCDGPHFHSETVIPDRYDHFLANYSYTITAKAGNLAKYSRVDGKGHAYINVKYTKYFDEDARYFVKDNKTPVHVYENDYLVGLICPVNIKEGVK